MKKLFLLPVLLLILSLSSCQSGVYVKAPVVCQYTGETALFCARMPKGSPYSEKIVKQVDDFLNGRIHNPEDTVRMIAVMYIIDVTEYANAGIGKFKRIDKEKLTARRHFWSPVTQFTFSPKTGAYSVLGIVDPLIPPVIPPKVGEPIIWSKINYTCWRKAATDWLKSLSEEE